MSWKEADSGIANTTLNCLAVVGTNLVAGTGADGVFLSTNCGTSWTAANSGLPNRADVRCLIASGTNLFAGILGCGVFRSSDNGASWTVVNSGLPKDINGFVFVNCLAISGTNLFAGTAQGIFLSADNGTNWRAINSGLPTLSTGISVDALLANGTDLYAGVGWSIQRDPQSDPIDYYGFFMSRNNGKGWSSISPGLPEKTAVKCLLMSGANLFAGTSRGLFISTNSGKSWRAINSEYFDALLISGADLFARTWGDVFMSRNNGKSWRSISSGLPKKIGGSANVNCLMASKTNLFAGTDSGVWRLPLADPSLTKR
jgi:ligand-binding sensor domain-containing protein